MADEPEQAPEIDIRHVMIEGYHIWEQSPPVAGLIAHLTVRYPGSTAMEIKQHVLQYTLVKLVAWLQPDHGTDTDDKKEPWEI